ncbi:MAG: ester cyclase [Pseudomonadota bacterium]
MKGQGTGCDTAKSVVAPLARLWDCDLRAAQLAFSEVLTPDAPIHLAHPFETLAGPADFADRAIALLYKAMPDLERRDAIVMAGSDARGACWVGMGGQYIGTFHAPFLGIPPTGRTATLRYHEFFRIEGARAVEMQALWDLPELMMQAGVWPLAPSLGREWTVPAPASQDGRVIDGDGAHALQVVGDMLTALGRSRDGVDAMDLPRYWHPRASWYGPSGIGTARGIEGFRAHHQIPFLDAMPDRRALIEKGHMFAEGDYVGFTAWPGMEMTLSGGGWLGLAGAGQTLTMRSLDFWRVEGDLIRENWVLVDLLDVFNQLGVDVFERMRALPGWRG